MPAFPEKTGCKQHLGRFKPGQSGNPKGKPRGTRHKATQAALELMDGQLEAITQKLVLAALDGDMLAVKLIMDKLVPTCKERRLALTLPTVKAATDLPKITEAILQAVGNGDLTPSEADRLASLAVSHGKVLELCEIEARISALEAENANNK